MPLTPFQAGVAYLLAANRTPDSYLAGGSALHIEPNSKLEWAHDSAWRFMPPIRSEQAGYLLHPIDLASNKLLALVGRDEPRDYLDIHDAMARILPLGALCWAASGKDPGFTPTGLLDLLRRRGKYQPEDFQRLALVEPVDLRTLKANWLGALESAEAFIARTSPTTNCRRRRCANEETGLAPGPK